MGGIYNTLPVAREGLPFIIVTLALTLGAIPVGWWLFLPLALCAGFCIWFFRDPKRRPPTGDGLVLSPADGVWSSRSRKVTEDRFLNRPMVLVSIFMSVFNVHVNRAPISGQVSRIEYYPGRFFKANLGQGLPGKRTQRPGRGRHRRFPG